MPTTTQIALTQTKTNGARCQALFSSWLQPSHAPTPDMVATAISRAVQQFGIRDCAGQRAQELGDHPDTAAKRMRWARQLIPHGPAAQRPEAGHEKDVTSAGSGARAAHRAPPGGRRTPAPGSAAWPR